MIKKSSDSKSKSVASSERKPFRPKMNAIVFAAIGVVLIGLTIATVRVAIQNAHQNADVVLENLPTADPYFFVKPSPSPTPTPSPVLPETGWVQTGDFGSSVKIRLQPSTDSLSLALVRDREAVNILDITNLQEDGYQWYQVQYGEDKGYIRSDFLVFEEPAALPDILYGLEVEDLISGKKLYSRLDYVSHAAPDVIVELTLADDNNFIGKKMYSADVALIQYSTGQKLAAAAKDLAKQGFQLVLWDAYRPYSVSVDMYEYVNDPSLLADPKKGSKHNRGAAVDVTLYKNGKPLNAQHGERCHHRSG